MRLGPCAMLPRGLLSRHECCSLTVEGRAVTTKERVVVTEMEKECERRGTRVSFLSLCHRVVFTVLREFSMR